MATNSSWSAEEVETLLAELASSGLSLAEFARRREFPAHRLYWARRCARIRKLSASKGAGAASDFEEVHVVAESSPVVSTAARIELRMPSGISICVTRDFDEVALRRLIGVLAPC